MLYSTDTSDRRSVAIPLTTVLTRLEGLLDQADQYWPAPDTEMEGTG